MPETPSSFHVFTSVQKHFTLQDFLSLATLWETQIMNVAVFCERIIKNARCV